MRHERADEALAPAARRSGVDAVGRRVFMVLPRTERVVDLVVAPDPEVPEHLVRRALEHERAARAHHGHGVAPREAARRVGGHEHAAALVGDPAQRGHQPALEHRVQAGGGLVEQQHRRARTQLDGAGRAAPLAA